MILIKRKISIFKNRQLAISSYLGIAQYSGLPDCSGQSHYLAARLNI